MQIEKQIYPVVLERYLKLVICICLKYSCKMKIKDTQKCSFTCLLIEHLIPGWMFYYSQIL